MVHSVLDFYRETLWKSWNCTKLEGVQTIPVAKDQLFGRAQTGRVSAWIHTLSSSATWLAVRDIQTGHSIHAVSDRSLSSLYTDLLYGLRIMKWFTSKIPVVWYWWDHNWIREVAAYEDPQKEHVNGGWAVPGVTEVHVYRREEAHKVLLHEMIHVCKLDIPQSVLQPVHRYFETIFGRRIWPHLGEAYTEMYAVWLWSIALSKHRKQLHHIWEEQKQCSKRKAISVWARIRDSTLDEDTNVFAYYVLKWVLMQHDEEILLHPISSVSMWISWWNIASHSLERDAKKEALHHILPLRMTCTSYSTNKYGQ